MPKYFSKLLVLAFVFSLTACGLLPDKIDETANWSASRLYSEAKDEMDQGGFDKAIDYYQKLESRYPFGTYAQQAQMNIAYAYYRQSDQPQAIAAIERFIKLHPNHPNVDYMYYLRGLVYFNDKSSIFDVLTKEDPSERDPKSVRDAFDSFKLLAEKFPDSSYTPDAIARMKYLVNSMAQYDVHVAEYYYRRGAYLAAAARAQAAIKDYPQAPANEEALFILMNSYGALGQIQLHDDTARIFNTNYPNSSYPSGGPVKKNPWWKIW
jgi:outer membrane protein assembly factor BamD